MADKPYIVAFKIVAAGEYHGNIIWRAFQNHRSYREWRAALSRHGGELFAEVVASGISEAEAVALAHDTIPAAFPYAALHWASNPSGTVDKARFSEEALHASGGILKTFDNQNTRS